MADISVIIPSYMPGAYLKECFNQLSEQTLDVSRFKVYFALNGPKDGFEKYVLELLSIQKFSYQYFYIDKTGVSNARNFLLDNSKEQFVAFLDDDDIISSNYLECLLDKASDDFISVSNVRSFYNEISDSKNHYIGSCFKKINEVEFSKFKSRQFFSTPWCKLIHRNIIGTTKFDNNLSVGEDGVFMAEISKRILGVKKADSSSCYYVRLREGSATRRTLNKYNEFKRVVYLLTVYSNMMISPRYERIFIGSRLIATFLHLKAIFKF